MTTKIFLARDVVTLDENCPRANAVAVRDGRVLHVGEVAWILEALRDAPYEVDETFADAVLVPGFIEAHGHLSGDGGLGRFTWVGFDDRYGPDGQLREGCRTIDAVIARLREAAESTEGLVVGCGFDPTFLDGRGLRREDLDRVSSEQSVLVLNASLHLAYGNSARIRERGIDELGDEPGLQRDADGKATGEFHETAMLRLFDARDFFGGSDEVGLRNGAELLRIAGVTTGSDLGILADGPNFALYREVVEDSAFPARVAYSPMASMMIPALGADGFLGRLGELRDDASANRFMLGPVKWIADGSIQGFTGKLSWPGYCAGEDHGTLLLSQEKLVEQLLPIHQAGLQVAIHANGDEAIEVALRAIAELQTIAPRPDHRHRLEHCQMISPSQLDRAASLGVAINFFTNHVYFWGDTHRTRTMGADKARRMNPMASALARGVKVSMHSDHPVTPVAPLFTMWCAVNRLTRSGHVLGELQRISPLEALRAVTLGAAQLIHRDHELGSIEVGKFADFTVLAANPLDVDPASIKDIAVLGTVVGGVPTTPAPSRKETA